MKQSGLKHIVFLAICAITAFWAAGLAGAFSEQSFDWGQINLKLRSGEIAAELDGTQSKSRVVGSTSIATLADLPPIQIANSCVEITYTTVLHTIICAIDKLPQSATAFDTSIEDDKELYRKVSDDLAAHINGGNAVVEESPQYVTQLLSQSWTVYSAVRKFNMTGVTCYGFTMQHVVADVTNLELVGRCMTLNGPGYIWGKYSDIARLENFFLNR